MACVAHHVARASSEGLRAKDVEKNARQAAERLIAERAAFAVADSTVAAGTRSPRDVAPWSTEPTTTLMDLARSLGSELACGCVLDIEGDDGVNRRNAHAPRHSESTLAGALAPLIAPVVDRGRTVGAGRAARSRSPPATRG